MRFSLREGVTGARMLDCCPVICWFLPYTDNPSCLILTEVMPIPSSDESLALTDKMFLPESQPPPRASARERKCPPPRLLVTAAGQNHAALERTCALLPAGPGVSPVVLPAWNHSGGRRPPTHTRQNFARENQDLTTCTETQHTAVEAVDTAAHELTTVKMLIYRDVLLFFLG